MVLSLKYGHGFEPKAWWEYYIYWLLRSSCFKHFDDGQYGLFSAKKLMERWYLLGFFLAFHDIPGLGKTWFFAQC